MPNINEYLGFRNLFSVSGNPAADCKPGNNHMAFDTTIMD